MTVAPRSADFRQRIFRFPPLLLLSSSLTVCGLLACRVWHKDGVEITSVSSSLARSCQSAAAALLGFSPGIKRAQVTGTGVQIRLYSVFNVCLFFILIFLSMFSFCFVEFRLSAQFSCWETPQRWSSSGASRRLLISRHSFVFLTWMVPAVPPVTALFSYCNRNITPWWQFINIWEMVF